MKNSQHRFRLNIDVAQLIYMVRALWRDIFHPGWRRADEKDHPGWVSVWLDDMEKQGEMGKLLEFAKEYFGRK